MRIGQCLWGICCSRCGTFRSRSYRYYFGLDNGTACINHCPNFFADTVVHYYIIIAAYGITRSLCPSCSVANLPGNGSNVFAVKNSLNRIIKLCVVSRFIASFNLNARIYFINISCYIGFLAGRLICVVKRCSVTESAVF